MSDKQQDFTTRLTAYQPIAWELIPDLGLYMDQVITFVQRQYKELFLGDERIFTPSMVNNYVKIGLVDRPVAKKYGREQLAQLLMICILKQSISAENMKTLLKPIEDQTAQAQYECFISVQQATFRRLSQEQALPPLEYAVQSATYQLLLNTFLGEEKPENKKPEPSAKEIKPETPKPQKKK